MERITGKFSSVSWRLSKLQRRFGHELYRHLFQDNYPSLDRSIMITGTARSGTTWLADIIASQLAARMMFEPFHPVKMLALRHFHYFQYLRPNETNAEFEAYCQRVFDGSIRDPWVDRQVEHLRPEYRVIKEVRANLLMAWIYQHFPSIPQLLLLRHPCAVVLSHLQLKWHSETDLASMLAQEKLVEDHLAGKMHLIEQAKSPEEYHALVWCIHTYVPLRQAATQPWNVVFYENLCTQAEIEIPRIFGIIGQDFRDDVYAALARPSNTARHDSAVVQQDKRITQWQKQLTAEQIANIQRIVKAFDLAHIYGDGFTPLIDSL